MKSKKTNGAFKEDVISFAETSFGHKPEYLWAKFPSSGILRGENGKWYAAILDVERKKIGFPGDGKVFVLDVKCEPLMKDMFLSEKGFIPAYHMNKEGWLGILLDGSVPKDLVFSLLGESLQLSQTKKAAERGATEWLIPSNPKYFDIVRAFKESNEINWKQGRGVRAGDTVYMYVGAPYSAVLYKCAVTETDIPFDYQSRELKITKLMRIRLLHTYGKDEFTFERLKTFGVFTVRGPRGVPYGLRFHLEKSAEGE